MNNDEIKALLRELKARSDAEDEVKGQTIRISLGDESPGAEAKKSRKGRGKKAGTAVSGLSGKRQREKPDEVKPDEIRPDKNSSQDALPAKAREDSRHQDPKLPDEKAAGGKAVERLEKPKKAGGYRKDITPWQRVEYAVKSYFADLKSRGIGGKELLMIGFGALLLVFIVTVICSAVFTADKSVNVTAEDGLMVTVEKEPEVWCASGQVELGIRTAKPIQSVTVNGESCEFEAGRRRTTLKLEAVTEELEVMVVSEEGVYHAQVNLPMIDTQLPQVKVQQENGQISLQAEDSRSGLKGVYYGTAEGLSDVPLYQEYSGPFPWEEGKIYYYYAEDLAGNRTVPAATNMEPAQGLVLNETEITLFPEESFRLSVSASPGMAYCNNLQLTNQDPSIVRLDADGTVTALQEGDAVIEATAEGLQPVRCTVQVRSYTELTVSALGDCTLGTDVNFNTTTNFDAYDTMYGSSYFFQNVRSILEADDVTFANFEGTLTTLDTRENKEYAFKGDPSYTQILQDGSIDTVTLANNHSSDYGVQSLTDTQQYLEESGIDYCIGDTIVVKEVNGVKVGLIGIYVLDEGVGKASQVQQTIEAAKNQGAQIIVTAFHWGSESSDTPDETQRTLAHLAVDSGADLVVGHHPHVLQGIELYEGKYIAYSLGNFCFGGNSTPSDMDTMIFQQTFRISRDGGVENGSIRIIPCRVSSQTGWNDYCPTPVTGEEGQRIMDKINERSAEFGQSYEMSSTAEGAA
ncbi:MAG: CapA family protein [Lachnospiraceae bacterium]|nr:CapA family protein [Lachnospiraceae bacterium]